MIQASANLSADDVSVPCRIRRSQLIENPNLGELENMTCTMRSWQPATPSTTPQIHQRHNVITPVGGMLGPQSQNENGDMVDVNIDAAANAAGTTHAKNTNANNNLGGPELLFESQPLRPYTTTPVRIRDTGSGPMDSNPSSTRTRRHRHSFAEQSPLRGRTSDVMNTGIWQTKSRTSQDHLEHKLYTVPISDIILVDIFENNTDQQQEQQHGNNVGVNGRRGSDGRVFATTAHCDYMTLTSRTSGFFEITFSNANNYEILLAFLKANLPPERIVRKDMAFQSVSRDTSKNNKENNHNSNNMVQAHDASSDSNSNQSMNPNNLSTAEDSGADTCADTFTASRIKERMKGETWGEKMRRRMVRVAMRITEASDTLTANCSCLNGKSTITPGNENQIMDDGTTQTKVFEFPHDLEFSQSQSVIDASLADTDLVKNRSNNFSRFIYQHQREPMDMEPFMYEASRSALAGRNTTTKQSRDQPSTSTHGGEDENNKTNNTSCDATASVKLSSEDKELKTSSVAGGMDTVMETSTTNQLEQHQGRNDINHSHHSNHSLRQTYEHMANVGEYAI